jgi:DNA-binding transcriptional regulator PaaX
MSSKSAGAKLTRQILREILEGISEVSELLKAEGVVGRQKSDVIYYLKKKELVGISEEGNTATVTLTDRGRQYLLKADLEQMSIQEPEKWDGKWRMVAFDIPEVKKHNRNSLKQKLNALGFVMVQKSLYLHPYDCLEEIEIISNLFEIRPFVKIFVIDSLEGEERLKTKFNLV